MPAARWTAAGAHHAEETPIDATLLVVACAHDRHPGPERSRGGRAGLRQRPGDSRQYARRHSSTRRQRGPAGILLRHLLRPQPG